MDSDIVGALQRTFATFQHQSELQSYFLFSVTLLERFLEHKLHWFSVFIECKESETEDFQHNTKIVKTTANAHVVTTLCPRSLPIHILMNSVILSNNVLQSLQHRGHVLQSVVVAKTDPGTIDARNVWCCGEGYFVQKRFAEKVRKLRQNVNRDKSA